MKVLQIVNVADAQSIPLELALAIQKRLPQTIVAGYYERGDHPVDHAQGSVISLGARKAISWGAIARLRALIRQEQPDIVHMHHAVSAFWCTALGLIHRPRPILVKTEHNDHRFLPSHQLAINAAIYPALSRIICNSDTTLASFTALERKLAGQRGCRIYNGVNLERVRAHPKPKTRAQSPIVIGNIGRLVPQKNQLRLIAGLAHARKTSQRDIRLEIVGHGPLRGALEEAAIQHGVADAVHFAGALPRAAVYEKLASWHGFVMASNFEGFCNALVEALAAGQPAAVSDIDTLREVGGASAIRFDHTDPVAIGAALVALADQPHTDGSFADRYDISRIVDEHLALYAELLGQRKSPVQQRSEQAVSLTDAGPHFMKDRDIE